MYLLHSSFNIPNNLSQVTHVIFSANLVQSGFCFPVLSCIASIHPSHSGDQLFFNSCTLLLYFLCNQPFYIYTTPHLNIYSQILPNMYIFQTVYQASLPHFFNISDISSQMLQLEKKLGDELLQDARVIACRFPFPHWRPNHSFGEGIDMVWAYDSKSFTMKKEDDTALVKGIPSS